MIHTIIILIDTVLILYSYEHRKIKISKNFDCSLKYVQGRQLAYFTFNVPLKQISSNRDQMLWERENAG